MNKNTIIVYDFETGGKNPNRCQPTQLAAVAIHPRKLEIIPNSYFNSEIRPIFDDAKCAELGVDPVEDEALIKTNKTRAALEKAPELKQVWKDFTNYIDGYKWGKKSEWEAPIKAGYNICNYDNKIIDRLCEQFGPWDKTWSSQRLFHPFNNIDLMHDFWRITENKKINNSDSISLDSIRDYLGMSKDGAHDGLIDVKDCAELVIRFLKLYRKFETGFNCVACETPVKIKFEKALANWKRPV
jgi:hypothetical protein